MLGESIIGWKSPELLGGGRRSTLESDVYTFGIVAYEVSAILASSLTVIRG